MGYMIYGYLIQFLIWIPLTILFLRIALPLVRAPFSDPMVGWVYSVTTPVLRPVEKIVPRWRNLSLAAVLLFWLVASLEQALLMLFSRNLLVWLLAGLAGAISFALGFMIVVIFVWVLFTFFQPRAGSSIVSIVQRLASPICNVFRRRIPAIGPFDLSPALAILTLTILRLIVPWAIYSLIQGP